MCGPRSAVLTPASGFGSLWRVAAGAVAGLVAGGARRVMTFWRWGFVSACNGLIATSKVGGVVSRLREERRVDGCGFGGVVRLVSTRDPSSLAEGPTGGGVGSLSSWVDC